jgi:hypothetical protein
VRADSDNEQPTGKTGDADKKATDRAFERALMHRIDGEQHQHAGIMLPTTE